MKYEDLERVNQTLKTTDIKGKDYVEVNQRIKAFRMLYPEGIIDTSLVSNENGVCVFKTQVGYYEEDGCVRWLATGYAYEKENSSFINKTSYIENCETSSVGRALGMLGIGIDTSVASYEEVANAINNQNKKENDKQSKIENYREQLIEYCNRQSKIENKERDVYMQEISDRFNLTTQSTEEDYKKALLNLKVGE